MKFTFNGKRLLQILFDRKISVNEIATAAGVFPRSVKNACAGKALQVKSASRIAEVLGVSIEELTIA